MVFTPSLRRCRLRQRVAVRSTIPSGESTVGVRSRRASIFPKVTRGHPRDSGSRVESSVESPFGEQICTRIIQAACRANIQDSVDEITGTSAVSAKETRCSDVGKANPPPDGDFGKCLRIFESISDVALPLLPMKRRVTRPLVSIVSRGRN
ncbi:hypothetical protein EDB87DRAFT_1583395 [Lactarius vividus]|nr:hypothetical protein EDB87DRAFT_1583395 [Lactarius vividus]